MPEVLPEELDVVCPPELVNFVKCVFCKKDLTEDADEIVGAVLLVCFHSTCKECVEAWNDSDTKFCPECKVDLPKDLVDHKLLQEMVEKPHSESTRKGMCGMHTETPATRWCHQCTSLVCDKCIEVHDQLKGTKTHDIVDATDILPTTDLSLVEFNCKLHPSMQFEIYCLKCEMMTCRNCQLEHHRQHNEYEFIADHCKEYKNELIKIYERMSNSEKMLEASQKAARYLQSNLRTRKDALRDEMSLLKAQMIRVIEFRFKNLSKELDSLVDADIQVIEDKVNTTSQLLVQLKHCIQVVDLMLLQASDNTIIHSKKHLEKCFQLLLRRKVEVPNPEVRKEYYFHKGANIRVLFEHLQNVGNISSETKNIGNQALYKQTVEQLRLVNADGKGNTPEKSVNPPARIQLRQDLLSPELRAVERLSTDSRASSSPEVGSMPHWHTPQEPPVPKPQLLAPKPQLIAPKPQPPPAVRKTPAMRGNAVSQNQTSLMQQLTVQSSTADYSVTKVPAPIYTITQMPSTNQRMPQDPSAPAMKLIISEETRSTQSAVMPVPPMRHSQPPQYHMVNQQSTRNPTNLVTQLRHHESGASQNHVALLQNALRSNNVTIEPSTPFHPQAQQTSQIIAQQSSLMQQQLAQMPSYQLQGAQMSMHQNIQNIYMPGSTHNPYPQM